MEPSIFSRLTFHTSNVRKRIFIFCCFAALINILYLDTDTTNLYGEQTNSVDTTKIKVILLWNPSDIWKIYDHGKSVGKLISGGGDDKKCIFTYEYNFLLTIDRYDSILFNSITTFWQNPIVRDVRQKYIFGCHESPIYIGRNLSDANSFYNITFTYRLNSDVIWPFGYIREVETNYLIAPAENPMWRKADLDIFVPSSKLQQLINGKTKSAAWFVSHCNVSSRREELVMELRKHINVDIFGKCLNATLSCPRNSRECDEILDNQYMFYLSFENSHCIDYVTEKLFRALSRTIVPVVFGGANYSRFAPPHSYIDAKDFTNIAELAKYLIYLKKNTTAYGEYFWWKSYYKIIVDLSPDYFPIVLQDLCHYLHKTSHQTHYHENFEHEFLRDCNTDCYYWWTQKTCKNKADVGLLNSLSGSSK